MDAIPASASADLAFLGDVARLLNSSADAEECLAAVTSRALDHFDGRAVRLWLREPNGTFFWSIAAPPASLL